MSRDDGAASAIAARAALRVLPLSARNFFDDEAAGSKVSTLFPTIRANLVAAVRANLKIGFSSSNADERAHQAVSSAVSAEAENAIEAGAYAAREAIDHAALMSGISIPADFIYDQVNCIYSVEMAARALEHVEAVHAFWLAIENECSMFDADKSNEVVMSAPIWFGSQIPRNVSTKWQEIDQLFADDPATWSFWRDWYQRVLDGAYQNQKLLYDIAVLPNADWEKGPEHIAALIRNLQAKHLAAATPIAEEIKVRESTGLIYAVPVAMPRADRLETILDQIGDALGDALGVNNNGLREQDLVTEILRRTLTKYRAVPWRVHQDCVRALEALETEIRAGNLPAGDPRIEALRRTLVDSALGIRSAIPEVKEQYAAELQTKFEELPDEPRAQVVIAVRYTIDLAEVEFATDARDDSALIEKRVASLEQKDALYRQSGRLSRIAIMTTVGGIAFGASAALSYSVIDQGVAALFYSYRWGQYQDVPLPPPVTARPIATQKPPSTGG